MCLRRLADINGTDILLQIHDDPTEVDYFTLLGLGDVLLSYHDYLSINIRGQAISNLDLVSTLLKPVHCVNSDELVNCFEEIVEMDRIIQDLPKYYGWGDNSQNTTEIIGSTFRQILSSVNNGTEYTNTIEYDTETGLLEYVSHSINDSVVLGIDRIFSIYTLRSWILQNQIISGIVISGFLLWAFVVPYVLIIINKSRKNPKEISTPREGEELKLFQDIISNKEIK